MNGAEMEAWSASALHVSAVLLPVRLSQRLENIYTSDSRATDVCCHFCIALPFNCSRSTLERRRELVGSVSANTYSMKWTAASLLLIPSARSLFASVPLLQGGLLCTDRQNARSALWLSAAECQEMSSLEMQKPSLHAGRPSDTVGCISGALFVLWAPCRCLMRKKTIPPTLARWEPGKQITEGCHDLPIWRNFISKVHLHVPRRTRALILDWWYCTDTPTPCLLPRSCLFSRPDEPRSSALIGCGNVEKALPARTIIYLCFNSPCGIERWKKKFLILQADHPETQDWHKFSIGLKCSLRLWSGKTKWIELQVHGFEVKYKTALPSSRELILMTQSKYLHVIPSLHLSQRSRFGCGSLKCTIP